MTESPGDEPGTGAAPRRPLWEIAKSGVDAVMLRPLPNLVTAACLVAMTMPFLVGFAISRGVMDQALDSVRSGGDVYVSAERFGLPVPVSAAVWRRLRGVPGVTSAEPRVVSPIVLGSRRERALLVGTRPAQKKDTTWIVDGRSFLAGRTHELVLGSGIARALDVNVGDRLPPFYRSRQGQRVSTVVGIFRDDAPIWQSRMVFTSFQTATQIADQPNCATDVVVTCEPGRSEEVLAEIDRIPLPDQDGGAVRLRATTREVTRLLVQRDLLHREGLHHALFALVFGLGVPVVLITSGAGLTGRRRECGLLRALGWRLDEVLLRGALETTAVAVAAWAVSVLGAWLWLDLGRAALAAPLFVRGAGLVPDFDVPYRMTWLPALVTLGISLLITLCGSMVATWRAASVPPAEAMT